MIRRLLLFWVTLSFLISGCVSEPKVSDILSEIENTPLFKIEGIYAKAEMLNPSGSIKDRMVAYLVKKAEERGDLKPGQEIIELTSGNTGVSLAMISAVKGYKFTAIFPESTSINKQRSIKLFGADFILTPAEEGFPGAKKDMTRYALKSQTPGFLNSLKIRMPLKSTGSVQARRSSGR